MSVYNGQPIAYTISINEEQRSILETALDRFNDGKSSEEAVILQQMLQNLPADELETPNAIHGLCV